MQNWPNSFEYHCQEKCFDIIKEDDIFTHTQLTIFDADSEMKPGLSVGMGLVHSVNYIR